MQPKTDICYGGIGSVQTCTGIRTLLIHVEQASFWTVITACCDNWMTNDNSDNLTVITVITGLSQHAVII